MLTLFILRYDLAEERVRELRPKPDFDFDLDVGFE